MEERAHFDKRDDRVPPQDVTAEKSLLGAIMISDNILPEVLTVIRPADFYENRHFIRST